MNRTLTPAAQLAVSGLRDVSSSDVYVNDQGGALVWISQDEIIVVDPSGCVAELIS